MGDPCQVFWKHTPCDSCTLWVCTLYSDKFSEKHLASHSRALLQRLYTLLKSEGKFCSYFMKIWKERMQYNQRKIVANMWLCTRSLPTFPVIFVKKFSEHYVPIWVLKITPDTIDESIIQMNLYYWWSMPYLIAQLSLSVTIENTKKI